MHIAKQRYIYIETAVFASIANAVVTGFDIQRLSITKMDFDRHSFIYTFTHSIISIYDLLKMFAAC